MAHKTPTAILELRGSFDHNPGRRKEREGEPVVSGDLGSVPKRLSDEQKVAWREIANNCAYGVLTKADRHSLEIASILLAELWANGASMTGSHISTLERLLAKFGMNPSDRSKVHAQEKKKENPFAKHKRK